MLTNQSRDRSTDTCSDADVPEPAARGVNEFPSELGQGCAGTVPPGTADSETGVHHASWSFCCDACAVPEARHLVCARLHDWGLDEQRDVVELLVSELVTNALRYAWGGPTVALCVQDGTLHCEVEDANPALPPPSPAHSRGEGEETGRGLQLVDLLSGSWGSDHSSVGKIVWFELPAQPTNACHE